MVNLIDVSIEKFIEESRNKKIIAVGAGRKLKPFITRHGLVGSLTAIVDDDVSKRDKTVCMGANVIFKIQGYDFFKSIKKNEPVEILITAYIPAVSILEKLDSIPELDGIKCYMAPLMEENFEDEAVIYTLGESKIPKVIHYMWFGHNEIPEHMRKYMESWNRIMPEYEIVRWDESNYDITKNKHMREAYECQKYGFVVDYARLDILYKYGGIYLDTDVEVIKPFDDLLCDRSFMGFFDSTVVAAGAGCGCEKGNDLIKLLRDYYADKSFYDENGNMNLTTCVEYQYPVLKEYGYSMSNSQQCINGNMIYPVQVFNPEVKLGIHTHYSDDTHSIHWGECSYEDIAVKVAYKKRTDSLVERNRRANA